jgi:hypothetical protein
MNLCPCPKAAESVPRPEFCQKIVLSTLTTIYRAPPAQSCPSRLPFSLVSQFPGGILRLSQIKMVLSIEQRITLVLLRNYERFEGPVNLELGIIPTDGSFIVWGIKLRY